MKHNAFYYIEKTLTWNLQNMEVCKMTFFLKGVILGFNASYFGEKNAFKSHTCSPTHFFFFLGGAI